MKIGDKICYIGTNEIVSNNFIYNKTYEIYQIIESSYVVRCDNNFLHHFHNNPNIIFYFGDNFISLNEIRMKKLEKINENIG